MRFIRPYDILAGFWVDGPRKGVPELRQFGEHWVPKTFETGMHKHWYWDLHYQVEGCTHWKHPGGISRMNTGEACLVAPGVEHGSVSHGDGTQHFYFIEIDMRPWLSIEEEIFRKPEFRILPGASSLHALFQLIIREGCQNKPHQPEALRHLLGLITLEVQRLILNTDRPITDAGIPRQAPPAILRAKDLIDREPERAWRIDELAYLVGLSPNYLTSSFRKSLAVSPIQYLHQQRIAKAKELLQKPDFSISNIAFDLGYSSSQHFSTRFKKETGSAPGEYRSHSVKG